MDASATDALAHGYQIEGRIIQGFGMAVMKRPGHAGRTGHSFTPGGAQAAPITDTDTPDLTTELRELWAST